MKKSPHFLFKIQMRRNLSHRKIKDRNLNGHILAELPTFGQIDVRKKPLICNFIAYHQISGHGQNRKAD
jgi:hypothetical protein